MKTYIKSILALATAALLGSSAWAAGFTTSPSTVSVAVGETKTVTISSTETADRTLAMGTNSETSNPYTKNTYFDAKLVNSSGTATLTIPQNGSLTLQITGKTQTSSAQTFTIYRNGRSTSCSVTITVTAASVAKTVEVGKSITLETETFANRYYYKLVGDGNATDYVTLSPTAGTRSQSTTYKTSTMTVTGKKATTSPVTVKLQTNNSTSTGGTYTDFKVYSITVTEPVVPEPDPVTSAVFNKQTITFPNGAVTNWVGGELVLKFKTSGTLNIPGNATARILVVGGGAGGAAGRIKSSSNYYCGKGGNGGAVNVVNEESAVEMPAGDYTITVGAGGNGIAVSGKTNDFEGGNGGSASSIVGNAFERTAAGGVAWPTVNDASSDTSSGTRSSSGTKAADGSSAGVTSTITGKSVEYGKGGIGAGGTTTINGANGIDPGQGGGGSVNAAESGTVSSGAGADGVVIVRIKSMVSPKTEVTRSSTLILKKTAGATTHQFSEPLDASFTWGTISANPNGVVTASIEKTGAQPKMTVTPQNVAGSTTLTVTGESDTEICTWTVSVTVNDAMPSVNLKGREIEYQNGTADETTVPGELIMTFTDTSKVGTLIIPEDATAQILVVGGGAGGAAGKSNSNNTKKRFNGSGGNAGQVIQKTVEDQYVLKAGSYQIEVGAGGVQATPKVNTSVTQRTDYFDFTGENGGKPSSLTGGDVSLIALGGEGWATKDAEGASSDNTYVIIAEGAKTTVGSSNPIAVAKSNDGYGAAGNNDDGDKDSWRIGIKSSISGKPLWYGVGGLGNNNGANYSPTNAVANTGNGGDGSALGGTSGAGGSGIVIVRLTYTEKPTAKTFSVTPVLKGDALYTSAITLTMTNAAGAEVWGSFDWENRETVPTVSGEYKVIFTPADKASYAITELMAQVTVLTPQEDSTTLVVTDGGSGQVKTVTTADQWNFVVESGAEFIETPVLTTDQYGAAVLTVQGKANGTAVIDLYCGSEVPGQGTFVKRVTVAVLPDAKENDAITVEEGKAKTSVTTTKSTKWNCKVQVGADFVLASVNPTSSGSAQGTTLTVDGLVAGTAIIDIFSGSTESGEGTLVKRVVATVVGPTEGYANRAVGTGLSITVKTEATIDDYEITSGSGVTVSNPGTSTTITGGSTVGATAEVRLYADGTLVKVVTVTVTKKPDTIEWGRHTVSYLGGTAVEQGNGDLLLTFTSSDGLMELPVDVIADYLVVGGGGSGSGAASGYRGNGAGGGKAVYEEDQKLSAGVFTISVGAGGSQTATPSQDRIASGTAGSPSSIADGLAFEKTAAGGTRGTDGVASGGTPAAGTGGANLTCGITGSDVTYGVDGAGGTQTAGQAGQAGQPDSGNGGQGGSNSTGGAGGNGVVIVRLKGFVETPAVATEVTGTVVYGQTIDATVFAGSMTNSAGVEVKGSFTWENPAQVTPLTVANSGAEYGVVFTPTNSTYYLPATIKGTLIVTPMAVAVYPVATNKVYGAEDPAIDFTTVPDVKGELTGALSRTSGENAGDKNVVIGTLTNENYVLTVSDGYHKFTIDKKPIMVTPVGGQEKTIGDETFAIAFTTNVAMIGTDHFTGALAAKDELGEQEITIGTLAIDDGNDGDNYALTLETGVKIKIVPATISITIEAGTGVADVQTNGVSVAGTLTLPAETTVVTLELVKGNLTIPVYKVITNEVTNVTQRVATYAVVGGLKYTFIAEEAEAEDPTVTPTETKQAIIDAIDEKNREVVGPKIDAVVDTTEPPAEGKVSAKDLASWITEKEISSDDMVNSDYLGASVELDTSAPITEESKIGFKDLELVVDEDSSNLTFEVELKIDAQATPEQIQVEKDRIAKYIQASENFDKDFTTIDSDRITIDLETGAVQVTPDPEKQVEFFKIVIPTDPGVQSGSEVVSTILAIATKKTDVAEVKKAREAVSVAWTDTDGSDIPLQKVVSLDAVTPGDLLFAWNGAGYDCWKLSAGKVWEAQSTVVVSGNVVTSTTPPANKTFALGEVIWLERQDASKPVHLCGGVDATADVPAVQEGKNLLSAPNFEAIDLDEKYPDGTAVEGDEVTLPIPDKAPKMFTFKDGEWGYQGYIVTGNMVKPGRVTYKSSGEKEKMLIPAGCGFFYKRQAKKAE